jgi:hypothetical protein
MTLSSGTQTSLKSNTIKPMKNNNNNERGKMRSKARPCASYLLCVYSCVCSRGLINVEKKKVGKPLTKSNKLCKERKE